MDQNTTVRRLKTPRKLEPPARSPLSRNSGHNKIKAQWNTPINSESIPTNPSSQSLGQEESASLSNTPRPKNILYSPLSRSLIPVLRKSKCLNTQAGTPTKQQQSETTTEDLNGQKAALPCHHQISRSKMKNTKEVNPTSMGNDLKSSSSISNIDNKKEVSLQMDFELKRSFSEESEWDPLNDPDITSLLAAIKNPYVNGCGDESHEYDSGESDTDIDESKTKAKLVSEENPEQNTEKAKYIQVCFPEIEQLDSTFKCGVFSSGVPDDNKTTKQSRSKSKSVLLGLLKMTKWMITALIITNVWPNASNSPWWLEI